MLKAATLALAALAMTSTSIAAAAPTGAKVRVDNPATITGAIYIPFEAYNAPQMWKNFDAAETDRDLGYARKIHLDTLRVWASYEYWKMAPAKFQANFDRFLAIVAQAVQFQVGDQLVEQCRVDPAAHDGSAKRMRRNERMPTSSPSPVVQTRWPLPRTRPPASRHSVIRARRSPPSGSRSVPG